MNLLLTSIGKRVQLIEHLKSKFFVVGADAGKNNAARYYTDVFYQIPRCRDDKYIPALLEICAKEEIKVLIPLYEDEFPILAANREKFADIGTILLLSDSEVIKICKDKNLIAAFFSENQIPAPKTLSSQEIEDKLNMDPGVLFSNSEQKYIVKPADGMGSEGVYCAHNLKELTFFSGYVPNCVVQECVQGEEITVDVLCDLCGEPVYIVPRLRLEVRSGEVVKSRTIYDDTIVDNCVTIIRDMKRYGNFIGPINIQVFRNDCGELSFIEINPRFGGGMPLSFEAGANFADVIYRLAKGEKVPQRRNEYKELSMYRFDQAVYEGEQ